MDWSAVAALAGTLLNNCGSPLDDGVFAGQTKAMEREVLATLAGLFRADADTPVRGYVSAGATEGTLWALSLARTRHRDTVVYHSQSAHYSVGKSAALLGLPVVAVRADDSGEIDYHDLRRHLHRNAHRPATVVATVGTTMQEAVDDIRRINAALDDSGAAARWIHADAALAGVPLALVHPDSRPGMDFADGADSIVVSGHKFFGTPMPCAVVLARHASTGPHVTYIDAHDATVSGSRDGHAPLALWWALKTLGLSGLRRRAERARRMAEYTRRRLDHLGWTAYRNAHAFTVYFKTPPEPVVSRWQLPADAGWSHVICMPGVTRNMIDSFLADLSRATAASRGSTTRPRAGRSRPTHRSIPIPGAIHAIS
jgi:histidine decarboxylase